MTDEPRRPDLDDELTGSLSDGITDAAPTELMSGHEAIRAARRCQAQRSNDLCHPTWPSQGRKSQLWTSTPRQKATWSLICSAAGLGFG